MMSVHMILSIITICKDSLPELRRTAESLRIQLDRSFEWVVIDGGSTDGTPAFLRDSDLMPRWISEADRGIANAFNKGMEMAGGKYLLFLNAGDTLLDPDVIKQFASRLNREKWSDEVVVGAAKLIAGEKEIGVASPAYAEIWRRNSICHQAAFIPRHIAIKFPYDERLRIGMDYDVWLRMTNASVRFHSINFTVCCYHLGGISSRQDWRVHAVCIHEILVWINDARHIAGADVYRLARRVTWVLIKQRVRRMVGSVIWGKLKGLMRLHR